MPADGAVLVHFQTLPLPGYPLAAGVAGREEGTAPPRLVVAVDPDDESEARCLLVLEMDHEGEWAVSDTTFQEPVPQEGDVSLTRAELDKLLYTTENLRKFDSDDAVAMEDAER